jgi:hypothetical protein
LAKYAMRPSQAEFLAGTNVQNLHVATKTPRANPHKRNAVTMTRIQIGLYLEYKPSELGAGSGDAAYVTVPVARRRTQTEKSVQKVLHTTVRQRASKEDRRLFAGAELVEVERRPGRGQQFHLFDRLCKDLRTNA